MQISLQKMVSDVSEYFSCPLELIHLSQQSAETASFNVIEDNVNKMEDQEVSSLVVPQKHRFNNNIRNKLPYKKLRFQLSCSIPGEHKNKISCAETCKKSKLTLPVSGPPLSQQDSALKDLNYFQGKVRREKGVNIQHSGHFSMLSEGRILSCHTHSTERTRTVQMPGAAGRRASFYSHICSASIRENTVLRILLLVAGGRQECGIYSSSVLRYSMCCLRGQFLPN